MKKKQVFDREYFVKKGKKGGKKRAKIRFKGKTKKEISDIMKKDRAGK